MWVKYRPEWAQYAAPECQCCCIDHTAAEACPAWDFGHCRGGGPETPIDLAWWAQFYLEERGMDPEVFFGSAYRRTCWIPEFPYL